MIYSEIFELMKAAHLSPEKAGKLMGVSGMTLRRWQSKPGNQKLPKIYADGCANAVYQLINDGKLSPESAIARRIINDSGAMTSSPAGKALGLSKDFIEKAAGNSDTLEMGLSQIGSSALNRAEVKKQEKRISSFQKWGEGWNRCIVGLTMIVRSNDLTPIDKLVAYGALFYLITPFDLVPDAIPGLGYVDDFAILSLALMYYERRFRHLFADPTSGKK